MIGGLLGVSRSRSQLLFRHKPPPHIDQFPFLPKRMGQADGLIGSISRARTYEVWVVRSTHQSRSDPHRLSTRW